MKTMRARLQARPLAIITNKEDAKGTLRKIQAMSQADFDARYVLKGKVMDSTNKGMRVMFCTRLSDGAECVTKVREKALSFNKKDSSEREWRTTTEVQLNMPESDTMCEFYEVIETPTYYYVIMEKVAGQDLFEQLHNAEIQQKDAREILRQVLDALVKMHKAGRIHKDLKLENVVVDMASPKRADDPFSPVAAKIIDFDTVQDWEPSSPKTKDVLGTDGYIAPEAYLGTYSPASDVYCVGVMMYKMLTKKFPSRVDIFDDGPGENYVGSPAMARIYQRLKEQTIDYSLRPLDKLVLANDLCASMLAFDSEARPSAKEALAHEWFQLNEVELFSPEAQAAIFANRVGVKRMTPEQEALEALASCLLIISGGKNSTPAPSESKLRDTLERLQPEDGSNLKGLLSGEAIQGVLASVAFAQSDGKACAGSSVKAVRSMKDEE